MQTLRAGSLRGHATAKCCEENPSCSKLFGFHNSGSALQSNFRVPYANRVTEEFPLSSWQKMCCACFSLRTLGQGNEATKKALSLLPHPVNDDPDTNVGKQLENT